MTSKSSADSSNDSDRHAIRLRGPWWQSPGSRFDDQRARRVQWAVELDAAEIDAFVMRRSFNCPTGLEAADRVHLVVAGVQHLSAIELNGQPLWSHDPAVPSALIDVEVSSAVQAVNQLDLKFALPCPALPRVSGEVRLEIGTAP